MSKPKIAAVLVALSLLALALLLRTADPQPAAWNPPEAPALEGAYAENTILKSVQKLAQGVGVGPEGLTVDAAGQLYAGYEDGRIVTLSPNGGNYAELANTGGRPLGLALAPEGALVIADAHKGLLLLDRELSALATQAGGVPLGQASDVASIERSFYFLDRSTRFGDRQAERALLDHDASGRLLKIPRAGAPAEVLLDTLHWPSGITAGPGEAYLLVTEAAEYRIVRYWLKGERAGSRDVFIDNLPGFPGKLSYNGRDRFWVALTAPRHAVLDALLPGNFLLRQLLGRLPPFLQPRLQTRAFVLGIDPEGHVVGNLQYAGEGAYAPVTRVHEHGPWLYLGSSSSSAIGRLPLVLAVPGAQPPLPGSERVPVPVPRPRRLRSLERSDADEDRPAEGREEDSSENRRYP